MDLDVSQVKDRIDLGGVSEPEISQNKATADIRLRDGEVNLIGGIIQQTDSRGDYRHSRACEYSRSRAAVQRRKRREGQDGTGDRDGSAHRARARMSTESNLQGWRRATRRRSRWAMRAEPAHGAASCGRTCRSRPAWSVTPACGRPSGDSASAAATAPLRLTLRLTATALRPPPGPAVAGRAGAGQFPAGRQVEHAAEPGGDGDAVCG